jgi:hypothetical protein
MTLLLLVILAPIVFSLIATWIILKIALALVRLAFAPARLSLLQRR